MSLQMFEGKFCRKGTCYSVITNFEDVFLTSKMDDNLVAIFEVFDLDEGTRQPIRVIDMCSEDRVTLPGREGSAIEPAHIIAEPTHIPEVVSQWNTDNSGLDAQRWNFKPNVSQVSISQVGRSRQ